MPQANLGAGMPSRTSSAMTSCMYISREKVCIGLKSIRREVRARGLCRRDGIRQGFGGPGGFEPTTAGAEVRDPSDEPATQGHQEPPIGVRDGVAVDEASADDLPEKQAITGRRSVPASRPDCQSGRAGQRSPLGGTLPPFGERAQTSWCPLRTACTDSKSC